MDDDELREAIDRVRKYIEARNKCTGVYREIISLLVVNRDILPLNVSDIRALLNAAAVVPDSDVIGDKASHIATHKIDSLRAQGFSDYETAAVLRHGDRYCIVGAQGDVRWCGDAQPVVAPAGAMPEMLNAAQHALEALDQMYKRAASAETLATTDDELADIATSGQQEIAVEAQEVLFIRNSIAALRAAIAQATQPVAHPDSARLEWYVNPNDKTAFIPIYIQGLVEKWTLDQWRAAIDAAMNGEK